MQNVRNPVCLIWPDLPFFVEALGEQLELHHWLASVCHLRHCPLLWRGNIIVVYALRGQRQTRVTPFEALLLAHLLFEDAVKLLLESETIDSLAILVENASGLLFWTECLLGGKSL